VVAHSKVSGRTSMIDHKTHVYANYALDLRRQG
jgi:hypothetical protein